VLNLAVCSAFVVMAVTCVVEMGLCECVPMVSSVSTLSDFSPLFVCDSRQHGIQMDPPSLMVAIRLLIKCDTALALETMPLRLSPSWL
jgi:hypothetical protein